MLRLRKLRLFGPATFTSTRAPPRRVVSRSPLQYSAKDFDRELGLVYHTIDVRIGKKKYVLDLINGRWILDPSNTNDFDVSNMNDLEKTRRELEDKNTILRTKLDFLQEMLTEIIAEKSLQQKADE